MTSGMITKYLNGEYKVYGLFTEFQEEWFQVLREPDQVR